MITPEFKAQVKEYFEYYRRVLNLPKSWRYRIIINDKIKEYATITMDIDKKYYVININPKRNKQDTDLKDTILHELLHSLLAPATNQIDILLEKIENKEEIDYKKAQKNLELWEERLVLKLTQIILKIK